MARKHNKPRVGDWFTIRSMAGGVDLKVKEVKKHKDGGTFVTAEGTPYWYDVSAIDEAAWVEDGQAIRDLVERTELEGRQQRLRIYEELNTEYCRRSIEVEKLLGIDSWGESKRPHKKRKGSILLKGSEETHQEVLAEIRRLKKLEK